MAREKTAVRIGGPNGAGKTSASRTVLRKVLKDLPFVNADHLAQGLGGYHTPGTDVEAGRLMLRRLTELSNSNASFALESTLAAKSLATQVAAWKATGYRILLFYFWLESPELAVARVAQRVQQGGHTIQTETIVRRYTRTMLDLRELYLPLADFRSIYDNSTVGESSNVARGSLSAVDRIFRPDTWKRFCERIQ